MKHKYKYRKTQIEIQIQLLSHQKLLPKLEVRLESVVRKEEHRRWKAQWCCWSASSSPRFTLWPRRENQELLDGLEKIGGQMIEQDLGIANSLDEQKKQGAGFNFEGFLVSIGGWLLYVANCRQSLAYLSGRTVDRWLWQLPPPAAGGACRTNVPAGTLKPSRPASSLLCFKVPCGISNANQVSLQCFTATVQDITLTHFLLSNLDSFIHCWTHLWVCMLYLI